MSEKKINANSYLNWALLITASAVVISAFFSAVVSQIRQPPDTSFNLLDSILSNAERIESLGSQTLEVSSSLGELLSLVRNSTELMNSVGVETRLVDFESRLEGSEELILGLRQAFNPTQPEEVLTIARLGDEVRYMRTEFEELRSSQEESETEFILATRREIDSASRSTNLILVVLIPLVLNFLYTLWKDMRNSTRVKKEE